MEWTPDHQTPLVLVLGNKWIGGWEGGVLCVLLAIDCMHLVGSHIITRDVVH